MIIKKNNRKTKGFTLVEVIIALSIVMVFVTVFSNITYTAIKSSTNSKRRLDAVVIAQNELEKIRANPGILNNPPYSDSIYSTTKTVTPITPVQTASGSYNFYEIVITVSANNMNPVLLGTRLLVKQP